MQIPRIIHQLWKDEHVPGRWREAVASVMRYHKGWEYRLWTDALVDDYVRTKHPRFYPVFAGMNRHIMSPFGLASSKSQFTISPDPSSFAST